MKTPVWKKEAVSNKECMSVPAACEKALGFLSPSAHEKMMANALGRREMGEKQIN